MFLNLLSSNISVLAKNAGEYSVSNNFSAYLLHAS